MIKSATAEIGKKNRGNMKDDEELEMLLDEIPHATSNNHNHQHQQHDKNHVNGSFHGMCGVMYDDDPLLSYYHKHTCASPVSGFSLQSDGSSSSLFSTNGQSLSDNGSPTPPPLEDIKQQSPDGLVMDSTIRKNAVTTDGLIAELGLCRNLSKMYVSNDRENAASSFRDFMLESNGIQLNDQINVERYGACAKLRKGFSDCLGIRPPVPMSFDGGMNMAFAGLAVPQQEYRMSNLPGSQLYSGCSDTMFSQQGMNCWNGAMRSPGQKMDQTCNYHQMGNSVSNLSNSLSKLSVTDALIYGQQNDLSWNEGRGGLNFPVSPRLIQATPHASIQNLLHHGLPLSNSNMARANSNVGIPHGGLEAFASEDGFIIQGEGLNYVINKRLDHSRVNNKGTLYENGLSKRLEGRPQIDSLSQMAAACGNAKNAKLYSPFSLPSKYNSLEEARGYVYLIAKDQHGCRFLQRLFDEGTQQDVQIIFEEIIDHVVELMMHPFGNYLMQKLLDVCNEEQRMRLLLMVTEEPGQLVKISLNTHGTRVVQKLIETLNTRQQISLVISALEPGFLALIKDLNGNHVVQRCLQCLTCEDNKFIFVAAAKYCVEIATHQHGCCVLQRCINRSTGKYQENLVAEISTNGLLLAQDAYGNYVVQFILDLNIPSATATLISQFERNFVHLSTKKFSSHVVEKCLVVLNDESRSRIIHELLSASHFEQLLQDPHANYVVQTALRVSEGPLHDLLVEAIESHKAISRNSPYSKRIFSQKLLKK